MTKLFVKKGDQVTILTGKDKGKSGSIIKSLPRLDKVVVEGVNIGKKHVKGKGIIEISRPIHVSNVKKAAKASKKKETPKKAEAKKLAKKDKK